MPAKFAPLQSFSFASSIAFRSRSNGQFIVSPRPRLTAPLLSPSVQSSPVAAPPSRRRPAPRLRGPIAAPMASPVSSSTPSSLIELNDASDFDALVNPEGYLSVVGFGSLLSERSARSTFPDLKNFRVAVLRGFRRVFAHVAPIFFERGIANEATGEISSLSVEPCEGEWLIVTIFEIKREEVPAFIERENEFRFLAVVPEGLDGIPYTNPAVVCARYSDEEYFQIRCKGVTRRSFSRTMDDIIYIRYGVMISFLVGYILGIVEFGGWISDTSAWLSNIAIFTEATQQVPALSVVSVLAAKNLGESAYDNFVDHTFLSDRKTSIRVYLNSSGSGIMEEEPPESLRYRYGG